MELTYKYFKKYEQLFLQTKYGYGVYLMGQILKWFLIIPFLFFILFLVFVEDSYNNYLEIKDKGEKINEKN